jgi:hypothetical protein
LYSASFTVLENQLGTNVVPTILNVRDKVFRHLQEIQREIDAGNFRKVLDQYPGLACPVVIENTMRIAAESIENFRKIIEPAGYLYPSISLALFTLCVVVFCIPSHVLFKCCVPVV